MRQNFDKFYLKPINIKNTKNAKPKKFLHCIPSLHSFICTSEFVSLNEMFATVRQGGRKIKTGAPNEPCFITALAGENFFTLPSHPRQGGGFIMKLSESFGRRPERLKYKSLSPFYPLNLFLGLFPYHGDSMPSSDFFAIDTERPALR
jgi:hypothetical protein